MKIRTLLAVIVICAFAHNNSFAQAKTNAPIKGTYKTIYDWLKDVPGVDVKTDGNGRGNSVTIRGTGSLTSQGQPLYVVDGSVYSGSVGDINPEEVESITVLKDAASQTAYGSRAMFGVIVINSKTGKGVGTTGTTAAVSSFDGSAYKYFIDHKTKLRVFGQDDKVIIEGVPAEQRGESLVFKKRKNETLVAIKDIKRVEMMPTEE
jgi:TonB-dependent SusC/RagA subfamily outer membrane receptor